MSLLRLNAGDRRSALRFAVLGNVAPIGIAVVDHFGSHSTVFFIGAALACVAPVVVTTVSRRHAVVFYAAAYAGIPALTMLQADSGGVASGYSVLLMMAMIWFGLQATDRELLMAMVVLTASSMLPMLVFGPPAYPVAWGHALLLVLVGCSVAGSLRLLARETVRLTRRLREEAVVDSLTGLLNRRGWGEQAPRELARAQRRGTPVCIVSLDLDKLKRVNDSLGHDEGDRLLAATAVRMSGALREGDVLARLGGDEFVALLTDSTLDGALGAVERLREVTPELGEFSAGVALWNGREDLDELLRRVDVALYAAKTNGGDRVEIAPSAIESVPVLEPTSGPT